MYICISGEKYISGENERKENIWKIKSIGILVHKSRI